MTRGLDPHAPLHDSAIPWLSEIPAHWGVWKVGHFAAVGNGSTPSRDNAEYWTEGLIPWLNSSVVNQEEVTEADQFITETAFRECHLPLVRSGSILVGITGQGKTRGQAVVLSFEATINQHLAFITPKKGAVDSWFLRWALFAAYGFLRSISDDAGGTKGALTCEEVGALRMPLPPIEEQRAIADFLNRETARLDALVAAKEQLLRRLTEKRRALITRAVTGGIDPCIPFRDSGILWLGEIPAHWEVQRLKFYLHRIEQGWSPQCDNTSADLNEWGVLKAGCVNAWDFDPSENKRLPENVEPLTHHEVRQGDVLMSRANTTALLGSTALVREVRPRLLLCDKLYRLGVNESNLCKEYLVAFLRSPAGRYEFERDATGASNSMQNIGQDSVRNLWLPIPPIDEQRAIVAHIAAETSKLDALHSATERTIALLKERRAALIAAAVTGELDLQGVERDRDVAANNEHRARNNFSD